jgi:exopolysaccharide production protein ExoZ
LTAPAAAERIVSLQILRFVAAMMIVVTHTLSLTQQATPAARAPVYQAIVSVGWAGVDIFFVLSGLVVTMTGPLATPRPSGLLFFWRRWRRVAPVYFVVSLPLVISLAITQPLEWDRLVATFLFWPVAAARYVQPYLVQGWTLCFEMVFYSTVALVLVGGRLRRNLIIVAAAAALLFAARVLTGSIQLRWLINPIFLEFCAGAALAAARHRLTRAPVAFGGALLALGVGGFAAGGVVGIAGVEDPARLLGLAGSISRLLLFGLPAVAVVAGALICERRMRGAIATILSRGGDASYMIYLTHGAAVHLVWLATPVLPASPLMITITCLAAAWAVGAFCHRVVERPILRDLKQLRPIRFPKRAVALG